jgi:hypothetical protein
MRKLGLSLVVVALLNAQSEQDPADILEQARDKLITRLPQPGFGCVATIDRSYYRRAKPPVTPRSCEQLSMDRKSGRYQLQLNKTDRLRLEMSLTGGHEIYSWAGPRPFTRSVDEIVDAGPIGTGELGGHLHEIFGNPLVRFRLLDQIGRNLQFGFHVPVETSNYLLWARSQWEPAGYAGSLEIDPASLELQRVTVQSDELSKDTTLCEASTIFDYPAGGTGVLLPHTARTHYLIRDSTETEWVTTFSDCRETPSEKVATPPLHPLFPPTWAVPFQLMFTTPIDTSTAAAGDVITAKLTEPMWGPSRELLAQEGDILTGRIMLVEHCLDRKGISSKITNVPPALKGQLYFVIWVDFDTIEVKGVISSIRARLTCSDSARKNCLTVQVNNQLWDSAFPFPSHDANIVIPAGYTSSWLAGYGPPNRKENATLPGR